MAGGRDDAAIAQALASMAQLLAQANEQVAVVIVILERRRSGGLIVSCETVRRRSRVCMTRMELRHACRPWRGSFVLW
jgi:hypothetical protein